MKNVTVASQFSSLLGGLVRRKANIFVQTDFFAGQEQLD
jgi:hypothetical protein